MALTRHIYIMVGTGGGGGTGTGIRNRAPCIWNTWIWLSFLLEYLMAWKTWRNFTCRAIAWEHFQKVFFGISATWANFTCMAIVWEHFQKMSFGISVASAASTCRTTVWKNCPAVPALKPCPRDISPTAVLLDSFWGVCPVGSGMGWCRPESCALWGPEISWQIVEGCGDFWRLWSILKIERLYALMVIAHAGSRLGWGRSEFWKVLSLWSVRNEGFAGLWKVPGLFGKSWQL